MPVYEFKCETCGHADQEFAKMANAVPIGACVPCPKCGGEHYKRQADLAHTDLREFHDPIEMFSIAMEDPEEIKAFIRKTGIAVQLDPEHRDYGLPIVYNRKQKKIALKAAGFVEVN